MSGGYLLLLRGVLCENFLHPDLSGILEFLVDCVNFLRYANGSISQQLFCCAGRSRGGRTDRLVGGNCLNNNHNGACLSNPPPL